MSNAAGEELLAAARSRYQAGDFRGCWELAHEGLADHPDDPVLLRMAAKAGLELAEEDTLAYLRRATELAPDDPDAWRDLGEGLALDGMTTEAVEALGRAVNLSPDDSAVLVDLAHLAYASGDRESAIRTLEQVTKGDPGNVAALRGLTEMHRDSGRLDDAVAAAERLSAAAPEDASALLDVAELNLELGRLDSAAVAFRRLRAAEDDPEHEIYAYHGMIETELRRNRWRAALDLAVEATRVDRLGRTTDVLAYIVSQVFGSTDRPTPPRDDVDAALVASRSEHRRLHSDLVL